MNCTIILNAIQIRQTLAIGMNEFMRKKSNTNIPVLSKCFICLKMNFKKVINNMYLNHSY